MVDIIQRKVLLLLALLVLPPALPMACSPTVRVPYRLLFPAPQVPLELPPLL